MENSNGYHVPAFERKINGYAYFREVIGINFVPG